MAPASDNNNQDLATKKAKLEPGTVLAGGIGKSSSPLFLYPRWLLSPVRLLALPLAFTFTFTSYLLSWLSSPISFSPERRSCQVHFAAIVLGLVGFVFQLTGPTGTVGHTQEE